MKKSLLALAVLGAFAGAASAQSSVTLYGKIDMGGVLDSGAIGSNAHSVRLSSGVSGGSRLGFKGSEDLGGGLRANFVAETGFCADSAAPSTGGGSANFCTGGDKFMGRQAWVGLSGGFGSFTMGRQYTPGFINLTTIDPFGTGYAGNAGNLFSLAGLRWNNSAIYATPSFGGFQVTAGMSLGETVGNWKAGRQEGFSGTYSAGPVYAGVAYNQSQNAAGDTALKTWNAGGVFDAKVVKIHALYDNNKSGTSGLVDNDDWLLGVSVPMGQGTIMASAIRHNDKLAANADATQVGAGYSYALSKRTSLYAAYAHISNKNGATFTVGNATDTGTGNASWNLGVVHNF